MIYHAFRQRGAYGNRIPGFIDPKAISDFIPTMISGLKVWWDFSDSDVMFTDAGSTKVSSDADLIYQINDKSTEANNAIQTNSSYRPLYKTNIQNGLSVARFDGLDDVLYYNFVLSTFTVFTVISYLTDNPYLKMYFTNGSGKATRQSIHFAMNSNTSHLLGLYADDYDATLADSVYNNFSAIANSFNSANMQRTYQNNVQMGTGRTAGGTINSNGNGALGAWYLDGVYRNFSNCEIGEVIVYDNELSNLDRSRVFAYLNKKWSLW